MHEHVTLLHPGEQDSAARGLSSGLPGRSAGPVRRPPSGSRPAVRVRLLHGRSPSGAAAPERSSAIPRELRAVGTQRNRDRGRVARRDGDPNPRVPRPTVMNLGLAFQIASSYAIAAAEFADPTQLETHRGYLGLSWVAVWVVLFTVVVPNLATSGAAGRACLGQLGTGHDRPRARIRRHLGAYTAGAVLLRPGLPLHPRRRHGLRRGARWSTTWAPRSSGPGTWGATVSRRSWARAEWARSGPSRHRMLHGPPPSS